MPKSTDVFPKLSNWDLERIGTILLPGREFERSSWFSYHSWEVTLACVHCQRDFRYNLLLSFIATSQVSNTSKLVGNYIHF